MMTTFTEALAKNAADVLTIAVVVGLLALGVLYWRARRRRVADLRRRINGEVSLPNQVQETLRRVFNLDSAEIATIGTVTLVDIAWQYSMAAPEIWDHFQGPGADHLVDALQNLDVLKSSLGDVCRPCQFSRLL